MYQKQFAEYFDKHMEEILRDLDEIISIESVGDINAPVKPFGEGSPNGLTGAFMSPTLSIEIISSRSRRISSMCLSKYSANCF